MISGAYKRQVFDPPSLRRRDRSTPAIPGGLPWSAWDALPVDLIDAFIARHLTLAQVVAHHADPATLRAMIGDAQPGPDWATVPAAVQDAFLAGQITREQVG